MFLFKKKNCTYLYSILGSSTAANFFIIYNASNVLMKDELGRLSLLFQTSLFNISLGSTAQNYSWPLSTSMN